MAGTRYEYSYIVTADGSAVAFGLYGVGEDVAGAVGLALQALPTINTVAVKRFVEQVEDVTDDIVAAGDAIRAAQGSPAATATRGSRK